MYLVSKSHSFSNINSSVGNVTDGYAFTVSDIKPTNFDDTLNSICLLIQTL